MYQDLCSMAQKPTAISAGSSKSAISGATPGGATNGGTAWGPKFGGSAWGPKFGGSAWGPKFGGSAWGPKFGRSAWGPKFGRSAWGPTFNGTPGRLRLNLSPLRSDGSLVLGLLFAVTTVGFNGRPKRPRPGLNGWPNGRFTPKFWGSASTTQTRDTRARSTWKTLSKLLVWITVRCCSSAEYSYIV